MISGVKTYVRARLLSLGFTEWTDGFNFSNIPKTKLESSYHVELGVSTGTAVNQDNQHIETPFAIRLFKAPTLRPKALIDSGIIVADTVIADLIKAENRLTQTEIKNVWFNNMAIEPLDDSNDNGLIIKIDFTALVIIGTR